MAFALDDFDESEFVSDDDLINKQDELFGFVSDFNTGYTSNPNDVDFLRNMPSQVAYSYVNSMSLSKEVHCTVFSPIDPYFKKFRLIKDARPHRNFDNDHPFAKLPIGMDITYTATCGKVYFAKLVSIDILMGIIELSEAWVTPLIFLDKYCFDPHAMHVSSVLKDFAMQANDVPVLKFFDGSLTCKEEQGVVPPYKLIHGCAGSGKTYQMVQEIKNRLPAFNLVVAPTNKALQTIAKEIVKTGMSCVHYTNDFDSKISWKALFKDNPDYKFLQQFYKNKPKNSEEANQRLSAIDRFRPLLFQKIVLVTPIMARSLYTTMKMKGIYLSIYVDEGGLMRCIDSLPLLLFSRNLLHVYGDYLQHEPVVPDDENLSIQEDVLMKCDDLINNSLASWMSKMRIPVTIIENCRRIPEIEQRPFVSFFYNADIELYAPLFKKTYLTLTSNEKVYSTYMPKALLSYSFLTEHQKEMEVAHLTGVLKKFVNAKNINYVYICSHNYIKDAILELYPAIYAKKKHGLKWHEHLKDTIKLPDVMTSYMAQSETFENVVFVMPRKPSHFIDDRMLLVSVSRHTNMLKIPVVSMNRFYPFKIIWYLGMIEIVKITYIKPLDVKRGNKKRINMVALKLEFNEKKFRDFVISGKYDSLLAWTHYKSDSEMAKYWALLNKGTYKVVEKIEHGYHFDACIEPMYKWILLFQRPEIVSIYRRADSIYNRVSHNGVWGPVGMPIEIPKYEYPKKREKNLKNVSRQIETVL